MLAIGVIVILLCIFLEGFFAGSEIGFVSCSRIKMSTLSDKGDKRAGIVIAFLENPEKFLSTTLVGVNLSVIIASSTATALVSGYLDTGQDAVVATLIILPLVLIFGEMVPKIVYQQHADTMALASAYPLKAFSIALFPFVFLATKLSEAVSWIFSRKSIKKNPYVTREEIRMLMLEGAKGGVLDKSEIDMTNEIFDFSKTAVHSVMVPLKKVVSASDLSTTKNVLDIVSKSGYSRIPIYSGRADNIIGTIEMSDLVSEDISTEDLKDLVLPPYIVRQDKLLDDVLNEFRNNQENVAIVVDRKGRAVGIATIEDIVEEIFGEIEDEYDVE